jgi:hypothetical protein
MSPKGVTAPLEVRYHGEKLHHAITVNVINIAKHIEATKIASRLNLRSRLDTLPPCRYRRDNGKAFLHGYGSSATTRDN